MIPYGDNRAADERALDTATATAAKAFDEHEEQTAKRPRVATSPPPAPDRPLQPPQHQAQTVPRPAAPPAPLPLAPSPPTPSPSAAAATLALARSKTALLLHPQQLRNPLVRHIRHVRIQPHSSLVADFMPSPTTLVLYLTLTYHATHPDYIFARIRALPSAKLRVLLVVSDVPSPRTPMRSLSSVALRSGLVLLPAAGLPDAARWLECLRALADSRGDLLRAPRPPLDDYAAKLHAALGGVRGVNRTDVATLAFTFGGFAGIAGADVDRLRRCAGMGERKVRRLFAAMHQPFESGGEEWDGGDAAVAQAAGGDGAGRVGEEYVAAEEDGDDTTRDA